jgi:hypothetical protein
MAHRAAELLGRAEQPNPDRLDTGSRNLDKAIRDYPRGDPGEHPFEQIGWQG